MKILLDPINERLELELVKILEAHRDQLKAVGEACSLTKMVLSTSEKGEGWVDIKAFKSIEGRSSCCVTALSVLALNDAAFLDKYLIHTFNKRFDFMKGKLMNMLTVNGLSDYNPRPCSNCGTSDWKAKNDRYCNHCADEWWLAWEATVSDTPNPLQKTADEVMENYGKNSCPPV